MRTNLTKESIFNLYKCKEVLKNSNVELYEELFKMFDDDLKRLAEKRDANDWNYLILILFFKFGKLTAKEIFKLCYPNVVSSKLNGQYNNLSNRLIKLFKDGVCYRISHLSEENRQYYEYHLNWENNEFEKTTVTNRILQYIQTHNTFTLKQLRDSIYPINIDILTPENVKRRIHAQLHSVVKYNKLNLYRFPNAKHWDEKVYYMNKNFTNEYLESFYNKHILNL